MALLSINPATGEEIARYEEANPSAVDAALQTADRAFLDWRRQPFASRAAALSRAGAILRRESGELARLMAHEMGKPITQGRTEAEKCAWVCDFYATEGERFLRDEVVQSDAARSYVSFEPLGIILAIMPWNFPFWQVFRCAAPALAAGNAVVLKHASNVSGCALAIARVLHEAGLPPPIFQALLVSSKNVRSLVGHPLVRAVSLTGSTPAGRAVAAQAGERLKKTVLELGGSDPYLILDDADVEDAARLCATARLVNSGQSCIAAKRFIVAESRKAEFESALGTAMRAAKMGDPLSEETQVGPLARVDLRTTLYQQVERSIAEGAKLILGGEIPEGPGAYYPPTILTDVRAGMPVYDEETFGPAAAVIAARDDDDAVRIANDSTFGLGAAIFTRDIERAGRLIPQLQSGCCFVNDLVRSDPRLPFGGIKDSGYGRELSHFGLREFVNLKTVWIR